MTELGVHWSKLEEQLQLLRLQLVDRLSAAKQDLEQVFELVNRTVSSQKDRETDLASFRNGWLELAQIKLVEPHEKLKLAAPLKKTVAAFTSYGQQLENLVSTFPDALSVSAAELIAVLGKRSWRRPLWPGQTAHPLPLKWALTQQSTRSLQKIQFYADQYLLALTDAVSLCPEYWQEVSLRWMSDQASNTGDSPQKLLQWNQRQTTLCGEKLERCLGQIVVDMVSAIYAAYRRESPTGKIQQSSTLDGSFWASKIGEAQSRLSNQRFAVKAANSYLDQLLRLERNLSTEQDSLMSELAGLLDWTQSESGPRLESEPGRIASVTPASNRLVAFQTRYRNANSGAKEEQQASVKQGLEQESQRVLAFLEIAERDHRLTLQALEQAREVLRHSASTDSQEIALQAKENVTRLLEHWKQVELDWKNQLYSVSAKTCRGLYASLQNANETSKLNRAKYYLTHLWEGATERGDGVLSLLSMLIGRGINGCSLATNVFLVQIGWLAAPSHLQPSVETRAFLPDLYKLNLGASEIPAIYRRLFSLESVSERRFLVYRETELAALDEAYESWQQGRRVAILLTGHRGTGKTSLLNCAFEQVPDDIEKVRGDLVERVTTVSQLHARLKNILGVAPEADLQLALAEKRRIIILEEAERTFIRQVGGYAATRELLRLIVHSNSNTLWVVGLNRAAFDLLSLALAFPQAFSHRVNTSSAQPNVLKTAILSRHNLSGLRLDLPGPAKSSWLSQKKDAQSEYFKQLNANADGVFRTAFQLWQAHIEKVEAGVMFMRPIECTDFSAVVEQLDLSDLFILVAILQHGSLTADELSLIFSTDEADTTASLDSLASCELIAPDPIYPGMRIRPEAAPVVRRVLYQRNMI
jgi:hypothetical protein